MTLYQKRDVLLSYLKMKTFDQDWRGVSDAANDLREIDLSLKLHFKDPFPNPTVEPKPLAKPEGIDSPIALEVQEELNKENTERVQKLIDLLKIKDEELVNQIFPAGAM